MASDSFVCLDALGSSVAVSVSLGLLAIIVASFSWSFTSVISIDGGHPFDDRKNQRVAFTIVDAQIFLDFLARLALRLDLAADGAHPCQGRRGQPFRRAPVDRGGRVSHGCAGACVRASARRVLASLLERRRCPDPHGIYSKAAPLSRVNGMRAPGDRPGALVWSRCQASRLDISLCSRWDAAPVLPFATRRTQAKRRGGRPSLHTQTLQSLGAARFGGCPSLAPGCAHHVRRRDHVSTPVRVRSSRRATAVARRAPWTPARSKRKSTQVNGLALRRDRQEGRELPWVPLRLGQAPSRNPILVKLKKVFDSADQSGDGEVDIHEFLMYLDMERTKLIEHIFRQFDTDGGDSLSFKEFALALWTFRIPGYQWHRKIHVRDLQERPARWHRWDGDYGLHRRGVRQGSNVAGSKGNAPNELERIRREEGGVIDRYEWEDRPESRRFPTRCRVEPCRDAVVRHKDASGVRMHRVLCGKTLGLKFWGRKPERPEEALWELPWPAISKNIRAGDLREDDREISKHEHSFKDCVSAAFKHAEHKNSLLQKDYDRALEHCQKNLSQEGGGSGRRAPVLCGRAGRQRGIEKLEDLKRSEHRMDNRLSREEWTDCFMEV